MFLGNEWRIVHQVDWSIKIWLRMLEFPKDGATVHAVKQHVVIVGLVGEPSVVQEHALQMLAAFRLWCYLNGGLLLQRVRVRAEAYCLSARLPECKRIMW